MEQGGQSEGGVSEPNGSQDPSNTEGQTSPGDGQAGAGTGSPTATSDGSRRRDGQSGEPQEDAGDREPLHDGEVFEKALQRMKEQEQANDGNQKQSDGESADPGAAGSTSQNRSDGGGKTNGNSSQDSSSDSGQANQPRRDTATDSPASAQPGESQPPTDSTPGKGRERPNRRPDKPENAGAPSGSGQTEPDPAETPAGGQSSAEDDAASKPGAGQAGSKPETGTPPEGENQDRNKRSAKVPSPPAATKPRPLHKAKSNPIHPASRRGTAAAVVIKGPARVHGSRKATLLAAPVPADSGAGCLGGGRRGTTRDQAGRRHKEMAAPAASRGRRKDPVPLPNRVVNRRTLPVPRRRSQNRAIRLNSRRRGKDVSRQRPDRECPPVVDFLARARVFVLCGGGA